MTRDPLEASMAAHLEIFLLMAHLKFTSQIAAAMLTGQIRVSSADDVRAHFAFVQELFDLNRAEALSSLSTALKS